MARASDIKLINYTIIGKDTFFSLEIISDADGYDAEGVKVRCNLGANKTSSEYEAVGTVKSKVRSSNESYKYRMDFYLTKDQQIILGSPDYSYSSLVSLLKANEIFSCQIFKPRYFFPQKNIGQFSLLTKEILPR